MALTYTIDTHQRLITITGEYAAADAWNELLGRILDDPRREPGFAMLRDLRDATTPTDAETVVAVIDVVRRFWPKLQLSRYAVLTPLSMDPAALVAQALGDSVDIPLQTFTSYDEAIRWLHEGPAESVTSPSPVPD